MARIWRWMKAMRGSTSAARSQFFLHPIRFRLLLCSSYSFIFFYGFLTSHGIRHMIPREALNGKETSSRNGVDDSWLPLHSETFSSIY